MATNSVVLIGRLTKDAQAKTTNSGDMATFSVAVNARSTRNGETRDFVDYFDCTLFGKRAYALSPYLTRGTQVSIKGHLRQNRWKDAEGRNRSSVNVIVSDIDLLDVKQPQAQEA